MTAPHYCPPAGICVPVTYRRCRDGDTVEVSLRGSRWIWAVRLLECWVDDKADKEFREAATDYAHAVCQDSDDLRLFVPFDRNKPIKNLLDLFTFDRVLGWLYVASDQTINAMMVQMGFATKEKPA